ncbi:MAG: hypothetical protein H7296_00865 [Bacteroidia bacterium]|nr:hypothetical protein [Bacteroidia bacterium]
MDYIDNATGTIHSDINGGGRLSLVELHPVVTFAVGSDSEKDKLLHELAHQKCFITNSFILLVEHIPIFLWEKK